MDSGLNYYYIKPTLNISNIVLIIIIIVFFCILIFKWNYITLNWENEKCNNSNFFLAPMFGKNSTETLQQCTKDIITKSVKDNMTSINLTGQINELNTTFKNLETAINTASSTNTQGVSNTISSSANILSGIQNNINNMKTVLTKVLGSVVLTSYMNDGVIQSTQNLENTDLVNMANQYNAVNNVINNESANPMPQSPV
jgi:hypothetical protein